jgi:hypothetical protein
MGLTTPPRKKSTVRKPKMWPRNSQIDCIEMTGRGPLRRRRSALNCRDIQEEELNVRVEILQHCIDIKLISFVKEAKRSLT